MNNLEDIKSVSQPETLKVNLYLHQLSSIYYMEKLESEKYVYDCENCKIFTNVGINADLTGYGKTLSMIGLICRDKMPWNLNEHYIFEKVDTYGMQHVKKVEVERYLKNNTTLILASTSIIGQWLKEFSFTNLKVLAITTKKSVCLVNPEEWDVIIISPTMYNFLCHRFPFICWKRFIYDEPTTLKVRRMSTLRAGFIWLITATPSDIYFNHKSTSKTNFISKIVGDRLFEYQIREYLTIKNDDEFVKNSFLMPPTNTIYHECEDNIFRTVNVLVGDKIAKMIEGGYISGAVEALGGKKTDNIIELVKKNKLIELEEIQSKIKIWTLRGDLEKQNEWEEKEKKVLRQLGELEKRFANFINSNCPICYEKINKPVMEPFCQNIFCGSCLLSWLNEKKTCPLCRKTVEQLVYIEDKKHPEEKCPIEKIVKKDEIILDIISDPNKHVIIFSDWYDSFEHIANILNSNNIEFIELKGTYDSKNKKLEKFFTGEIRVVFLKSKIDSSGLNMQKTTDIIFYHTMNESTVTQIIGRANRIGRKTPLNVHHLISV